MVLIDKHTYTSREEERLKEDRDRIRYWKKWGPYVAERQWATGKFFLGVFPRVRCVFLALISDEGPRN